MTLVSAITITLVHITSMLAAVVEVVEFPANCHIDVSFGTNITTLEAGYKLNLQNVPDGKDFRCDLTSFGTSSLKAAEVYSLGPM